METLGRFLTCSYDLKLESVNVIHAQWTTVEDEDTESKGNVDTLQ